jgi:hypothetical protein
MDCAAIKVLRDTKDIRIRIIPIVASSQTGSNYSGKETNQLSCIRRRENTRFSSVDHVIYRPIVWNVTVPARQVLHCHSCTTQQYGGMCSGGYSGKQHSDKRRTPGEQCEHVSTIGSQAFPVVGPQDWNSLPEDVTSAPSLPTFRQRLKTYLFRLSFLHLVL